MCIKDSNTKDVCDDNEFIKKKQRTQTLKCLKIIKQHVFEKNDFDIINEIKNLNLIWKF